MKKVVLSWSGGKDSMMALKRLWKDPETEVCGLMTAFSGEDEVVNLHYVPYHLIRKQAEALNLELFPVYLPEKASNEVYEREHKALFKQLKLLGISTIAFGDIHLEPIREYRDRLLADSGMEGHYPLWQASPTLLVREFFQSGFEAIVTAIDQLQVPVRFLGKPLSDELMQVLEQLDSDPCGENGEYHTFVCNGPGFQNSLSIEAGEQFEMDFRPEISMRLLVSVLREVNY